MLAKNYKLSGTSTIKTGSNSYVELLVNGRQNVLINEGSQIKINELSKINSIEKTKLSIVSGNCYFKLKKLNKDSSFIVETDSIILSVIGTEFSTGLLNKDISNVSVYEGVVTIKLKTDLDNKISKIRNISPEIADNIENTINQNLKLSKGQTIQISNNEIINQSKSISEMIQKIETDFNTGSGSAAFEKVKLNSKQTINNIDKIIKNIYFKDKKESKIKPDEKSDINLNAKTEDLVENITENNEIKEIKDGILIGEWLFNGNSF